MRSLILLIGLEWKIIFELGIFPKTSLFLYFVCWFGFGLVWFWFGLVWFVCLFVCLCQLVCLFLSLIVSYSFIY